MSFLPPKSQDRARPVTDRPIYQPGKSGRCDDRSSFSDLPRAKRLTWRRSISPGVTPWRRSASSRVYSWFDEATLFGSLRWFDMPYGPYTRAPENFPYTKFFGKKIFFSGLRLVFTPDFTYGQLLQLLKMLDALIDLGLHKMQEIFTSRTPRVNDARTRTQSNCKLASEMLHEEDWRLDVSWNYGTWVNSRKLPNYECPID